MPKVLFIEDEKFVAELVTEELQSAGFTVLWAADGDAGLKMMKKEKPQLLLLDIVLPGINGYEVLRRMHADSDLIGTPVIVLSNLGQKEQIEEAIKLGAKDYLVKANVSTEDIVSKIKKYLS